MAGILKGQAGSPIEFEVKPTVTGESEVLLRNEIVGTVSQTAGVPTGAIIQRGSNANGEFIRYADGTQICWYNNITPTTSWFGGQNWSYPIGFSHTPTVMTTSRFIASGGTGGAHVPECGNITTTSATVKNIYVTSGGVFVDNGSSVQATASGRWY